MINHIEVEEHYTEPEQSTKYEIRADGAILKVTNFTRRPRRCTVKVNGENFNIEFKSLDNRDNFDLFRRQSKSDALKMVLVNSDDLIITHDLVEPLYKAFLDGIYIKHWLDS